MEDKKMDPQKKAECHKKIAEYLRKAADLHEKAGHENDCAKAAELTLKAFGFICEAKCHIKKMAKKCAGIECCNDKK